MIRYKKNLHHSGANLDKSCVPKDLAWVNKNREIGVTT